MDHRIITFPVPVVNKVQILFASEPCKSPKPRSLRVVFIVEKYMRVERRCTRDYEDREEIKRQYEICTRARQKNRDEEVRRSVAFAAEVRRRDEMGFGIIGVMEVDVVAEKLTAHRMVGDFIMYQCLTK